MKRLNPNTNKPFRRGDVREDGFIFFGYYTKIIKSDGYFKEIWLNQNTSQKIKDKDKNDKRAKYRRKSDRKPAGYYDWPLEKRAEYDVQKYNLTV